MMSSESPRADVTHAADLALVRDVLAGSSRARDEFVRRARCVPRLVIALSRRLGVQLSQEETSDLSQEVLVRIWRRLDTYEGRGSLETWAHRFCFYQLQNTLRRRQRRGRTESFDPDGPAAAAPPAEQPSPEAYALLARCLDELGSPVAEVIRLKHYEHLTFEEIGARLGLPTGTAKTHYYRGLERMRARLKGVLQQEDAR